MEMDERVRHALQKRTGVLISQAHDNDAEETSRLIGHLDSSLKLTLYALVRLP